MECDGEVGKIMESHKEVMESHKEVMENHEDVMENLVTVRPCLLGPSSTCWPCPGNWGSQITWNQPQPLTVQVSCSTGTFEPIPRRTVG